MIVQLRLPGPAYDQAMTFIHQAAQVHGTPLSSIEQQVQTGAVSMWALYLDGVMHAAFTTAFTSSGLMLQYLGGHDLPLWLEEIEAWARQTAVANGVRRVFMWGRAGWARAAQEYGWEERQRLFVREV